MSCRRANPACARTGASPRARSRRLRPLPLRERAAPNCQRVRMGGGVPLTRSSLRSRCGRPLPQGERALQQRPALAARHRGKRVDTPVGRPTLPLLRSNSATLEGAMVGTHAVKTGTLGALALATLLLAGSAPMAQQGAPDAARLETFKATVTEGVEARRKLSQVMNDTVFSFGELAYQEFETSKYLTDLLEKNGFSVERGIANMPTAWVARWGSGRPVIALGSDLDCIPKANQVPGVAYRQELVEGAPGHGEGHNSGQAVNIVAALAVKELMEREKLSGTLVLWPGVAEELLGGKAHLVRAGVFRDIDAVLYTHVSDNFSTAWGQPNGTGLISVEYTFNGESAHAAARPWRGRNALRAVELMNIGWDLRREQLRPEQRSHYVITNGGDQPNVIPSVASVWYFIREMDFENIKRNYEIANTIADAAAMMTDTKVTRKVIGTAAPRHYNRALAEALAANFTKVGTPTWTPQEQA